MSGQGNSNTQPPPSGKKIRISSEGVNDIKKLQRWLSSKMNIADEEPRSPSYSAIDKKDLSSDIISKITDINEEFTPFPKSDALNIKKTWEMYTNEFQMPSGDDFMGFLDQYVNFKHDNNSQEVDKLELQNFLNQQIMSRFQDKRKGGKLSSNGSPNTFDVVSREVSKRRNVIVNRDNEGNEIEIEITSTVDDEDDDDEYDHENCDHADCEHSDLMYNQFANPDLAHVQDDKKINDFLLKSMAADGFLFPDATEEDFTRGLKLMSPETRDSLLHAANSGANFPGISSFLKSNPRAAFNMFNQNSALASEDNALDQLTKSMGNEKTKKKNNNNASKQQQLQKQQQLLQLQQQQMQQQLLQQQLQHQQNRMASSNGSHQDHHHSHDHNHSHMHDHGHEHDHDHSHSHDHDYHGHNHNHNHNHNHRQQRDAYDIHAVPRGDPTSNWTCKFCEYEKVFGEKPVYLIRWYNNKMRKERESQMPKNRRKIHRNKQTNQDSHLHNHSHSHEVW